MSLLLDSGLDDMMVCHVLPLAHIFSISTPLCESLTIRRRHQADYKVIPLQRSLHGLLVPDVELNSLDVLADLLRELLGRFERAAAKCNLDAILDEDVTDGARDIAGTGDED